LQPLRQTFSKNFSQTPLKGEFAANRVPLSLGLVTTLDYYFILSILCFTAFT
jgi:hypothetical protein